MENLELGKELKKYQIEKYDEVKEYSYIVEEFEATKEQALEKLWKEFDYNAKDISVTIYETDNIEKGAVYLLSYDDIQADVDKVYEHLLYADYSSNYSLEINDYVEQKYSNYIQKHRELIMFLAEELINKDIE